MANATLASLRAEAQQRANQENKTLVATSEWNRYVNLADWFPVNALMDYSINTIQGTVAAGDGVAGIVTTETYNTAGTNPSITVQMISNAGTAAEVRNGATLLIALAFKNTAQAF